jgi:flagellar motor switch protein FliM
MEPILSKEEIADLLSAIKSGAINVDAEEQGRPIPARMLLAREIDLFQTYERKRATVEARIPNFDIIVDAFARLFGSSLTNQLQRTFYAERLDIGTTSFQESLTALGNQGAVGIYTTEPLKHGCLFHFDTQLSFTLLEMMLGALPDVDTPNLERPLTSIEISILKQTMTSICDDLQRSFKQVADIRPRLVKAENNFRLVNIVDSDTEVLTASFAITASGQRVGRLRFIMPYLSLEPLRERLREMVTVAQTATSWGRIFAKETLDMTFNLIARSGALEMSVRQILQLRPGDIVDLGYDPDRPLTVLVEDQPKFLAMPGEHTGKKAIHITGTPRGRSGEIHGAQ